MILISPLLSKVPPQPLWFAPGLANIRKLHELPYHLLHAGLWEELQQEVIGKMKSFHTERIARRPRSPVPEAPCAGRGVNVCCVFAGCAEWLYCKSRVCGVSSVIQDLDQCARYMDCTETGLIRDALILMKPTLDFLDGHMGQ